MIKRRAERRSDSGMIILLDLGRDQIGSREGEAQFYECERGWSSHFCQSTPKGPPMHCGGRLGPASQELRAAPGSQSSTNDFSLESA